MRKKYFKITALLIAFTSWINVITAQNEFDALRFSMLDHYGDARFNAMGGSFGALGANMSALSINPGGIGVYKSSDLSFSPSFHYNYTESEHHDNTMTDNKLNFHFGNLGFVAKFDAGGKWEQFSMGFGYNRISNFNNRINIESTTDSSSLSSYVNQLNVAGGTYGDDIEFLFPFSANLSYQTYLINPLATDSLMYDHVFQNSTNLKQTTTYKTKGGIGEYYFAFGGNYSNKLYVGGSLSMPTVNYGYARNYKETSLDSDTMTSFKSFSVHDRINTSGIGVNFKLGFIYKIANWVRIGGAIHTPTFYSLTDEYETNVYSELKNGIEYSQSSPSGGFDYHVTTPYRFISSVSFVGQHGAINVDYEIVDYSTSSIEENETYGSTGADFSIENRNIESSFVITQNIRVGAEWRVNEFDRIRAGYRWQGNPLSNDFSSNYSSSIYSVGVGRVSDNIYADIGYALKIYTTDVAVIAEQNDFSTVHLQDHYLTFTCGVRF